MDRENTEESWRGHPTKYWFKYATKAALQTVISSYSNGPVAFAERKEDLLHQTMQILDSYQPPLTDEHVHSAIRHLTAPPKEVELHGSQVPEGTEAPIASIDQMKPTSTTAQPSHTTEHLAKSRPLQNSSDSLVETPIDTETSIVKEDLDATRAKALDKSTSSKNRSADREETTGAITRSSTHSARAERANVQDTTPQINETIRKDSVVEQLHIPADSVSSNSLANQTYHHTQHAHTSNTNRTHEALQAPPGSLDQPIDVENIRPAETFTTLSRLSIPSSIKSASLSPTIRRYVLQLTDASLQPAKDHRFLLPVDNTAASKVVNSKQAFESLLDDRNDPDIHSVQIRFIPSIPFIHDYQCSPVGYPSPYRGAGPVWYQNSCHVDCCIVAARLMSVGQVQADLPSSLEGGGQQQLTEFQMNFRDFLALPWERYSRKMNIKTRHDFLHNYYIRRSELHKGGSLGSMHAANDSWQVCAEGFGQFQYAVYQETTCDKCSKKSPKPADVPRTGVLEFNAPAIAYWKFRDRDNITQLFEKHFAPKVTRPCTMKGCKGQTVKTRIVDGELPQRLVIPTPTIPNSKADQSPILKDRDIVGATSSLITVKYRSTPGQKTAHYRWLGGIYEYNKHYRLYWSDRSSGEGENLMMYDGLRLNGSILGGVPSHAPRNAVPPPWSQGCDILFYERIYPEKAQVKADTIRTMIDDILEYEQLPGSKRKHEDTTEESSGLEHAGQNGSRKKKSPSPKS